jgi:CheY-like chemotaxis protein
VNQLVASKILASLGCTFEIVDNGRQAVQACLDRNFDLILMDCHMPDMVSGFYRLRLLLRLGLAFKKLYRSCDL